MNPRARLLSLSLALATLLLYLPVREFAFINYDDPEYVTQNRVVQAGLTWNGIQWAFSGWQVSNWHPLTWLSHMLDCGIFGLDPGPHHLVSALIHALNAGLLCGVLMRLTGSLWAGAMVAALFALHPLRVESVAWVSERKDVLSGFFFCLTLWAYWRYALAKKSCAGEGAPPGQNPRAGAFSPMRWHLLTATFLALGLMCKPMLVTVPCLLLLLDYWPLRRGCDAPHRLEWENWGRLAREKWSLFLLAAVSCVVTYLAQRGEAMATTEVTPLGLRFSNAAVAYARYLLKTLWPTDLAVLYPLPESWPWSQVFPAVTLLLGLTWLAWRYRAERPHLIVGWLWFLGTLVPVIGIVQVGSQAMADRYTYLPQIGIFVAVVFEARYWLGRFQAGWLAPAVGSAVVLLLCAVVSTRQLSYWKSSETLFSRTVQVTRNNAVAHINLGIALQESGRLQDALREYQTALRLRPSSPEVHNNLGNLLTQLGAHETALAHYRETLRLKPRSIAHLNLAAALGRLGRFEEALQHCAEAERSDADDTRPFCLRGQLALWQGRSGEALAQFREALRRDPNDIASLLQLARLRAAHVDAALRNGAEAAASALRAHALAGGAQPVVLEVLAMAFAESGNFADAQQIQEQLVERARATSQTNQLSAMQQRLEHYRASQPWREALTNRATELPW
jgi:tetratricopeptide (TPR) repeat protein